MNIKELSRYVSSNILVKDTFAYTLINLASRFLSLLALPFLSSVLSLEDYGIIGVGIVTFNFLAIVTQLGFDQTFQRVYLELKDETSRTQLLSLWVFNALLAMVCTIVLFFIGYKIVSAFLLIPDVYIESMVYVYLALLFYYPTFIMLTYYRMKSESKYVILLLLLQTVSQVLLSFVFVFILKYPVQYYFVAFFLSYLLSGIPAIILLKNKISFRVSLNSGLNTSTLTFGWPLLLSLLSNWIILQSSPYLITIFSNREQTGLFHIANSLASVLLLLTWSFQQAFYPYAFTLFERVKENAFPVFRRIFKLYILLFSSALFSGILLSREILLLLTNESFVEAASAFGMLLLSNIFSGLMYFVALPFFLDKKSAEYGMINGVAAILAIVSMVLLIPYYGHLGGAAAIGITTVSSVLLIQLRAGKVMNISFPFIKGFAILLFTFVLAGLIQYYDVYVAIRIILVLIVLSAATLIALKTIQTTV